MAMEQKYVRSPGIKRLMREAIELAESTEEYCANPLEDNLFEWHFTVRGPPNTDFQDGLYHGRIILPTQYPMKPPDIILLTPNGRFETNTKICLSISGHHPESWQPSWSIRTALLALIAFMPTKNIGAIGALDYTPEERKLLAKKSRAWECDVCGKICEKLSTNKEDKPTSPTECDIMQEIPLLDNMTPKDSIEKLRGKEIKKLFETRAAIFDNESLENLVTQPEEVEVIPPSEPSIRDQVIPIIMFFIVVTIVVLMMRRFIIFGLYRSDKRKYN